MVEILSMLHFITIFAISLGITINELLAGEHLNTQDNQYYYEMNLHNRINSYNNINRKNKIIIFMIFSTLIF